MTDMATTSGPGLEESPETVLSPPTSTETALITEQQVLFSTAAAAAQAPARTRPGRRWRSPRCAGPNGGNFSPCGCGRWSATMPPQRLGGNGGVSA